MRVLITGNGGKSGSWAVRATQMGAAIGAEVQAQAEVSDCRAARIVVAVKRVSDDLLSRIRESERFFVWDMVDAWPQPAGNLWNRERCLDWIRQELLRLQPDAVVWPTHRTQEDAGWIGPQTVLPHHAWPKYQPVSVRPVVKTVGYEGGAAYLGRWHKPVQNECERRGWAFVVNGDMQKADIGVALRDTAGYAPGHWKPGTKLANLQALGLPALCSPEAGYREGSNGTEYWIERREDLTAAFDELGDQEVRAAISIQQQQTAPRLANVAKDYKSWLETLV
jgi:hypothetical protein